MNRAEKIKLLTIEYTQDDLGEWAETRAETEVFARIESVTMSEFYQAGMQGFKPEYKMTVWQTEYNNEELIEYGGVVYVVYRAYIRDDGRIELYVTKRKGEDEDDA